MKKAMECKVTSCPRKRCGKQELCRSHYERLLKYGNTYAAVPIGHGGRVTLPMRRKILQAKPGFRYCTSCKKYKKAKKFTKKRNQCRLCIRNIELKVNHGIDNKGYDRLLEKQKSKCALCRTKKPGGWHNTFCVDHDHRTGRIRGLLCDVCNRLIIGNIEKRKISIPCLAKYLRKTG